MRGKGDQETQDIQSAKCLQPSSDVREARRMSTQDSLFIKFYQRTRKSSSRKELCITTLKAAFSRILAWIVSP
ncbi:MAG: hypothetical protein PHH84_05115 [Oscillospiraceae bacterium]|nr:hypothetical protein [Oscillospiraceae bacterium]